MDWYQQGRKQIVQRYYKRLMWKSRWTAA